MSFDHDMQMKVKDEVIKDLESALADERNAKALLEEKLVESEGKHKDLFSRYGEMDEMNILLNEKLAEKDKVIMSQEKERQSTEQFWKLKLGQLEQQLKEANEELAESEKDRDQWIHKATLQRLDIGKLEQRLQEAEEVVRFYGDPESWIGRARNESTEICDDDNETNSLYAQKFTKEKPMGLFGKGDFIGGKRARAYLAKHEAKQEEK